MLGPPITGGYADTESASGHTRDMRPLAVHHVSINVSDVDEAVTFYTEVLGGTVRADRPDFGFGGAWIDLGASQLHLLEAGPPPVLGQHFAIRVADLDEAVSELRAGGVVLDDPSPVGPGRQTFLADPAGNTVELYELVTSGPVP
jgi:glyoxylase I family protein